MHWRDGDGVVMEGKKCFGAGTMVLQRYMNGGDGSLTQWKHVSMAGGKVAMVCQRSGDGA